MSEHEEGNMLKVKYYAYSVAAFGLAVMASGCFWHHGGGSM